MIYNIIEVANTHGGNIQYLLSLIDEYSKFKGEFGIKFQAFKYNKIAAKDYSHYELYKKLFFSPEEWTKIISRAFETKDVWLDIFDDYGIEIFKKNFRKIKGIKLQSSVLYNQKVLNELSVLPMESKKVIINVAGYNLDEIEERTNEIDKLISSEELLVEVGFQSYPTTLIDSGLTKVKKIKEKLKKRVVFADHVDGNSDNAIILPLIASLIGADVIEKHVMHSELETKYDHFSSVTLNQYEKYIEKLEEYKDLANQPFISPRERDYLESTIQVPFLSKDIEKGNIITNEVLKFKRTNKRGLDYQKISELTSNFNVLATDKEKDDTLVREDFKKANIATIIACRLKSTRLKRKALLPIGNYTSIELCIKNALKIPNVSHTVLATSVLDEDSALEKYTYRDDVIFHQGDPENVIERYLDIINDLKIDVFIRITGDCPYISSEIAEFLLESHFKSGADYTAAKNFAVGTSIEVINTAAFKKINEYFPNAEYSEYMTWYFINNPDFFNINIVKLPQQWIRDYRLTLDYEEDLQLFREIENHFISENLEYTIYKLYDFLDNNPDIANINSHLTLKYKTDKALIETLNKETKIDIRK